MKNCKYLNDGGVYVTGTSKLKPCCMFNYPPINASTYDEYSQKLSKVDTSVACSHCIHIENAGGISHRQKHLSSTMFHLTLTLGSQCNLRCVTCYPDRSILVNRDMIRIGELPTGTVPLVDSFSDKRISFAVDTIKNRINHDEIKLTVFGGEPMLCDDFVVLTNELLSAGIIGRVNLSTSTNGTYDIRKFDNLLSRYKSYNMVFSIDGINKQFEYLRFGAKWATVEQNILSYAEANQSVHLVYTLSWMNALHLLEFDTWASRYDNVSYSINIVNNPTKFSPDILPLAVTNKLIDLASGRLPHQIFKTYKAMLTRPRVEYDFNIGTDMLAKLDVIRGTNYKDVFADMLTLIQQC